MTDQTTLSTLSLDANAISKSSLLNEKDPEKMKKACADFESLFLYQLMQEMRNTIPKSGLMGDGKTEDMYNSIMDLELSREIASKREIGIATMLYNQLSGQVKTDDPHKDQSNEEKGAGSPGQNSPVSKLTI